MRQERQKTVRHYVSVCSQTYLPMLVAQQQALRTLHPGEVASHVLCMDPVAMRLLQELDFPDMHLSAMDDFEAGCADGRLLACKAGRTQAEYCWTAKPHFLLQVLTQTPGVDEALYLDSDLFPFSGLDALWEELASAEVLLFPHRFPERLQHLEAIAGRYNAGMVGVRNGPAARKALTWWCERCLEWCFYRAEDGKLGDQKYLESFPALFGGVRDCADEGVNVAPWNVERHAPEGRGGQVRLGGEIPLRLYHFHQYKFLGQETYAATSDPVYVISPEAHRLIYVPFTTALSAAWEMLRSIDPAYAPAA